MSSVEIVLIYLIKDILRGFLGIITLRMFRDSISEKRWHNTLVPYPNKVTLNCKGICSWWRTLAIIKCKGDVKKNWYIGLILQCILSSDCRQMYIYICRCYNFNWAKRFYLLIGLKRAKTCLWELEVQSTKDKFTAIREMMILISTYVRAALSIKMTWLQKDIQRLLD